MIEVREPVRYVVVSGPPGSGKTTLANSLAPRLLLPLLSKDTIKQALMQVLPVPDIEASRTVGRASVAALLAVAAEVGSCVVESVWHRTSAARELAGLTGQVVEVFCRCDPEVVRKRYRERSASRVAGHFDADRSPDELWNDEVAAPVSAGWPVVEVDTSRDVDIEDVVRRIAQAFDSAGPR